LKNTAVEIWW